MLKHLFFIFIKTTFVVIIRGKIPKHVVFMEAIDLINRSKLSEYFGVSRTVISKKRIPKKYDKRINLLVGLIEFWMKNEEL